MSYVGVRIPNEIIIVEKLNSEGMHQGYVVESGNAKTLDSALYWAKTSRRKEDNSGYETVEGICNTYKNGSFKICLKDSAEGSSQGGKLSFWNCIILAPDGKEFLVGINADILLEFLLHNDLFKGACYAEVFLGRIGGNVGVFTKNMPAYKQFIEDEKTRQACSKKTSAYKPGDIVSTLTSQAIYLGTIETRFDVTYSYAQGYQFTVYTKPHLLHVFQETSDKYKNAFIIDTYPNKPKRTIIGHIDNFITPEEAVKEYYKSAYMNTDNSLLYINYTFKGTNEELINTLQEYS